MLNKEQIKEIATSLNITAEVREADTRLLASGNVLLDNHHLLATESGQIIKVRQLKNRFKSTIIASDNLNDYVFTQAPSVNGNKKYRAHQLVFIAFTGVKLQPFNAIHHLNGQKNDNRLTNLMLTTIADNSSYYFSNKTGENDSKIENMELKQPKLFADGFEHWVFNRQFNLLVSTKGRVINAETANVLSLNFKSSTYNKGVQVHYTQNNNQRTVTLAKLYVTTFFKNEVNNKRINLIDPDDLTNPMNYYL